ncbi:MAG: TrmH family RNA methyltransferase [Candidatus Taylorbacteria bacterium]|nr:TrmH family RNA methyltransferase [Candidatus Taylorbacteria bacterium]
MKSKTPKEVYVVLCNIRSIHNVGSIFRTAECFGVSHVLLVGYTPTPVDRFKLPRKDFAKVSLGAEKNIIWSSYPTITKAITFLKGKGVQIIAVEQDEKARDYKTISVRRPIAFLLGNEVGGIPKKVLTLCDVIAEIPVYGTKESLNVSVSAGIALAEMVPKTSR